MTTPAHVPHPGGILDMTAKAEQAAASAAPAAAAPEQGGGMTSVPVRPDAAEFISWRTVNMPAGSYARLCGADARRKGVTIQVYTATGVFLCASREMAQEILNIAAGAGLTGAGMMPIGYWIGSSAATAITFGGQEEIWAVNVTNSQNNVSVATERYADAGAH